MSPLEIQQKILQIAVECEGKDPKKQIYSGDVARELSISNQDACDYLSTMANFITPIHSFFFHPDWRRLGEEERAYRLTAAGRLQVTAL